MSVPHENFFTIETGETEAPEQLQFLSDPNSLPGEQVLNAVVNLAGLLIEAHEQGKLPDTLSGASVIDYPNQVLFYLKWRPWTWQPLSDFNNLVDQKESKESPDDN